MSKKFKFVQILVSAAILLGLFLPMGYSPQAADPAGTAKIQPALLSEIAAAAPDEMVRIIGQKADSSGAVEAYIQELGGQVLSELDLINAFAAQLPAKEISKLAQFAAVNWVSLDGAVVSSGKKPPKNDGTSATTTNTYLDTLGVRDVWAMGYDGQGIGIAIIDSGAQHSDLDASVVAEQPFNVHNKIIDTAGHGTHVAGIIAGSGAGSNGDYAGIAPGASIIALNISEYDGMAYESDTVAALQWVYDNKDEYNIRVVNLSIQSTVEQSYHESAINAATEILWFNGIVVVAASGNWDLTTEYINPIHTAPANDPFIITVGATTEKETTSVTDDAIASFTAEGETQDYFLKPEIYAPGTDIISTLANMSMWDYLYPERKITTRTAEYFRASGTSMAAPMVSGAAALLLQAEPDLTPDQVKYRLINASAKVSNNPYLDVYAAIATPTTESANQGIIPHRLLAQMAMIAYWTSAEGEEDIDWENVDWNAVNWNAVNWNAVNWNAVNWNAVNWNAVNWNAVNWNAVNWNAVNWNAVNWNSTYWGEE